MNITQEEFAAIMEDVAIIEAAAKTMGYVPLVDATVDELWDDALRIAAGRG